MALFGLNKDDEETQDVRREKGLPPRERPINQGSLILKLAFELALHSPKAQTVAKALEPIQQGVGAKRGMEMIAHVCNALYSEGYAILKMDATNGFQEIKRSSLHHAVERKCPSLLYSKNIILRKPRVSLIWRVRLNYLPQVKAHELVVN